MTQLRPAGTEHRRTDPPAILSAPPDEARTPRHIPGEAGLWVLIVGDMVMFAVFFGVIEVFRGQHRGPFLAGQAQLHPGLGTINTMLLLTSSLLVAAAVRSSRAGRPCLPPLLGALACALGFVAVKVVEYTSLLSHGHTPASGDFFMYYFVFTGIHLLHLVIGIGVLLFLMRVTRGREPATAATLVLVEGGASFWHMVDLLWIALFPLLYLVR